MLYGFWVPISRTKIILYRYLCPAGVTSKHANGVGNGYIEGHSHRNNGLFGRFLYLIGSRIT